VAGRVRGFETVGDMARSLAVVGAFVLVIVLITLRQSPDHGASTDLAPVLAGVAQAAPSSATIPGPTPAGWTPTSARVSRPSDRPYYWYVGYVTDTKQFVAVSQVYGDASTYLRDIDARGARDGTVTIKGKTWQRLLKADGSRRVLVRTEGNVTTVVVGTAPYAVLESTASALRPARLAGSSKP